MKSQQAVLEQILSTSIKKTLSKLSGQPLKQFEQQLQKLPKRIKQLDATPYMFIFKTLIQFGDCVDFVLHQYKKMIEQRFLPPQNPYVSEVLAQHLINKFRDHQFMVTQVLMTIAEPNLKYFIVFFNLHTQIPLPQNVLQNYRLTGLNWLSRAFRFQRGKELPEHIQHIYRLIFRQASTESLNFPTVDQTEEGLKQYINKIVNSVTFKISQSLQQSKAVSGKFGYCFMCLQPADYYCKDTKVPVCGAVCKKEHLKQLHRNPYLAQQYPQSLLEQIQELLINNLESKSSLALSVDYLCMIYMFSDYRPKLRLPLRDLIHSAIIQQRIWLLLAAYYYKKDEMFQHILAYSLKHKKQHIRALGMKYFHMLLESFSLNRFFTIYYSYDVKGPYRLVPTVIQSLQKLDNEQTNQKDDKCFYFVVRLIQLVFNGLRNNLSSGYNKEETNMIKLFNEDATTFFQWYKDKFGQKQNHLEELSEFFTRNEALLHKDGLCQIVYKDENFCKVFLKHLVQPLQEASIDEVLREVFYYLNIKISDRIYRLFELLFQVYRPPSILPGFSTDRLFQFAYYLLMLQTDFHTPSLADKRPTIQDMLDRIKSFDEQLAKKKQQYLIQIYNRILEQPFSQQWKPISNFYRPILCLKYNQNQFDPSCIIADNWESIYQKLKSKIQTMSENSLENIVGIIFKCCTILMRRPNISQHFLQMLISIEPKLKGKSKQDILQAISNIIIDEPNCVKEWKEVVSLSMVHPEQISLHQLVIQSKRLTDSHLLAFAKEMMMIFPLASCAELYMTLIHTNKERISILDSHFLKLFTSEQNLYIQLLVVESCWFLKCAYYENLNLGSTYSEQNQSLVVDTLSCLAGQPMDCLNKEKWNAIYQKTKKFQTLNAKLVLASLYSSNRQSCPFYQDYIIEQTINTNNIKFIEIQPSLISNFQKFEPYIALLTPQILAVFVKDQNFQSVLKHFDHFVAINEFYKLLRSNLEKKTLDKQIIQKIMVDISQITDISTKQKIYYGSEDLLKFITDVLLLHLFDKKEQNAQCLKLLEEILLMRFELFEDNKFQGITAKQLACYSLFGLDWVQYVSQKVKKSEHSRQNVQNRKQESLHFDQFLQILTKLRDKLKCFTKNFQLRLSLMKEMNLQCVPGFLQHQRKLGELIMQLYFMDSRQRFRKSEIQNFLSWLLDAVQCKFELLSNKTSLSKDKAEQEMLKKQMAKDLIEWKTLLLTIINKIMETKSLIPCLQTLNLLQNTMKLSQNGYFQWNGDRIVMGQNQSTPKLFQFQRYLLSLVVTVKQIVL